MFMKMRGDYNQPGNIGLLDLLTWANQKIELNKMVEIGSYAGEGTRWFAISFAEVSVIDSYDSNNYIKSKDTTSHITKNDLELSQSHFEKHILNKFKNVHLRIESSIEAVAHFEDESLDMVYVDGGHSYEEVYEDIERWLSKVRYGGIISGHDYDNRLFPYKNHLFPGVKNAVLDTIGEPDKLFIDTSWAKIKERI